MKTRDPVAPATRLTCDICGGPRDRSERHRLVWEAGHNAKLVLAELCGRCAQDPGRVLDFYGGRGNSALRVTTAYGTRDAQPRYTALGIILRGLVYVLVALGAFVVVTSITSH